MKTVIPYVAALERMSFDELCAQIELHGRREFVGNAPWPAFPYKPITAVDLAASEQYFFARFFVRGLGLKAEFCHTNEPVWQDSCVEIFIGDADGAGYRNFEINKWVETMKEIPFMDYKGKIFERLAELSKLANLTDEQRFLFA